ncbi:methylenetetrahydrofolate reductase [Aestuariibius insulae]|uniref:methylenetetrahydrofolate reductase n=1 Tax=Aestuariibius insulae TaxID=2058287 RepID=UPI00345E8CCA
MPRPSVSFEVFPPRSDKGRDTLLQATRDFAKADPDFISVTYGAGGSTRTKSVETAALLQSRTGLSITGHLTCAGQSRAEVLETAEAYRAAGITRILALRGDPTDGADHYTPHPDGFATSCDLIETLAKDGFDVTVAAYPDPHPDSRGTTQDLDWLKRKQDAGASAAITQFSFSPERYLRPRDAAATAGVTLPLIAGILPVKDWDKARRFAKSCGAPIPLELEQAFDTAERHDRARLFALTQATELCTELVSNGMTDLHFYTLNSADLTLDICTALGAAPRQDPLSNAA